MTIAHSTQAATVALRPMTPDDIAAAADLTLEQQWPHRAEDWALFLKIGEGLVAQVDGQVVGTIMAWRFGPHHATLGMVIVAKAMQGRGIGRRLMDAMLERLASCTVLLYATSEGLPLYRKLGFVEIGGVEQHQAVAPVVPLVPLREGERVRPMGAADGPALDALYAQALGMDRAALMQALLPESQAVVLTQDDEPVGFALLRRFGRGWAIAPVVAPDADGAKALISHWLGTQAGSFCRIDLPHDSGLGPWLADLGLPRVGGGVRMTLGPAPVAGHGATVFGLAAQALG